ncbi:hypothetical protein [Pelagibacterium sp.]|uniref:hypothetical protein n=1 Tax=Pelagibacterium sp. TaxID=1967288 RepID=UPI003A906F5C
MIMDVPYLQQRGNSWRYRRKVPPALKSALGKGELVFPLGSTKALALSRYGQIHKQAEAILARAAQPVENASPTALDLYKHALSIAASFGLSNDWTGRGGPDDPEDLARDVIAEDILAKYQRDEDDHPIGVSQSDKALLQVLARGAEPAKPKATLEDARRVYLSENIKDDKKAKLQLDNIFKLISPVLTPERPLASISRADARAVRDCLLDGRTIESAKRYLNTVRSMLNVAIRELELTGKVHNHFLSLPVGNKEQATPGNKNRDSFTEQELEKTRARVLSMARTDIQLIWRILEMTGCRPSEVAGLRVEDVYVRHAIPHIDVEWHEVRRVKTLSSRRKVPLLGDALMAAREAVALAGSSKGLFSAYFREGGPDSFRRRWGSTYVPAYLVKRLSPTRYVIALTTDWSWPRSSPTPLIS